MVGRGSSAVSSTSLINRPFLSTSNGASASSPAASMRVANALDAARKEAAEGFTFPAAALALNSKKSSSRLRNISQRHATRRDADVNAMAALVGGWRPSISALARRARAHTASAT